MDIQEAVRIIRSACIRANPDILEMNLGCRVEVHLPHEGNVNDPDHPPVTLVGFVTNSEYLQGDERFGDIPLSEFVDGSYFDEETGIEATIIGREIRLSDVLQAIKIYGNKFAHKKWEEIVEWLVTSCHWKTDADDLNKQTDGTKLKLALLFK